jgi:hypothetical protein
MAGGSVHVPWYATGFRKERLNDALAEIVPIAARYGATGFALYRYRDDRYKFLQVAAFGDKTDFERYWYGPEFTDFRVNCSSWYQVPVVYAWTDLIVVGEVTDEPAPAVATPVHTDVG